MIVSVSIISSLFLFKLYMLLIQGIYPAWPYFIFLLFFIIISVTTKAKLNTDFIKYGFIISSFFLFKLYILLIQVLPLLLPYFITVFYRLIMFKTKSNTDEINLKFISSSFNYFILLYFVIIINLI